MTVRDSAAYAAKAKLLSDQISRQELAVILREFLTVQNIEGDATEFGCYVGTASVHIARFLPPEKRLFVYDSFSGLPEKTVHDYSPAGEQFQPGELHATKRQFIENCKKYNIKMPIIKKGWFNELSDTDIPRRISFAFLDGDYYDSVRHTAGIDHTTFGGRRGGDH